MPDTIRTTQHWYRVYLGAPDEAHYAGPMRMSHRREPDGRHHLCQRITMHGDAKGGRVDHDAVCDLTLQRKAGRYVPLEMEYHDGEHFSRVHFLDGRLQADGAAAEHDGQSVPDDLMPTWGLVVLAGCIFNQQGASLRFTPMADSDGTIGNSGSRLVAKGKTKTPPFGGEPLWEVAFLSSEGTQIQAFYFDDEGLLRQADWGGSLARLVEGKEQALA